MTPRILLVDDEADIRWTVGELLRDQGFEVVTAGSAEEALGWIAQHGIPHLAIVDIMMPEVDGIELSRRLHELTDVPIIMLSAVDESATIAGTIREFAEDYVVKPFDPEELAARIRRVLGRFETFEYAAGPRVVIDDRLVLELNAGRARVDGAEIELTPTENRLLHVLVRHAGRPVSTAHLLRRLWPREEVFEDSLRVHVHRLRRKIEADPSSPRYLRTERGLGYRLEIPRHPSSRVDLRGSDP